MDDGDGAEQWWLWCSGDVSRGEAQWRELRGHGGGAATGGMTTSGVATTRPWAARLRRDNGMTAAREDGGDVKERWRRGGGTEVNDVAAARRRGK
jgi:hypothetical protein